MQIASGLHRVGSEIINSYLIVDQDGVTITDAGLPGYWKLLEGELSAIGKTLADVDRARLKVKKPVRGWGPVKVGPLAGFLWYSARHGGLRIPPASQLQTVTDNDVLDVPGSPRIIHTPGHTPGSVAVHLPVIDALFVGDTMTTRNVLTGVTGPKPAPFTLNPDQAVASLDRIEGIDATWLLPGHGPAWSGGVPEAVGLIREAAADSNK
jgi:glyoxylase-like metal-dependent hydrolase (beta-lactamase superfamily II)